MISSCDVRSEFAQLLVSGFNNSSEVGARPVPLRLKNSMEIRMLIGC